MPATARHTYATSQGLISQASIYGAGLTLCATRTLICSGRLQQTHPEGLLKNRSTYWGIICSRDCRSRLQEASTGLPEGHFMSTYLERRRPDLCCSTDLVKCARRSVVHRTAGFGRGHDGSREEGPLKGQARLGCKRNDLRPLTPLASRRSPRAAASRYLCALQEACSRFHAVTIKLMALPVRVPTAL